MKYIQYSLDITNWIRVSDDCWINHWPDGVRVWTGKDTQILNAHNWENWKISHISQEILDNIKVKAL